MQAQAAGFSVEVRERPELAMLAIQGPHARARTSELVSQARAGLIHDLKPFQGMADGDWFIGRTGYTGEDGLEIILPAEQAPDFLSELVGAGIPPIGLGARDTLRLAAGLNLYGQDMTEDVAPLAANMGWTVAWETTERDFVGRAGLEQQRARDVLSTPADLVLGERGLRRAHPGVRGNGVGPGSGSAAGRDSV